MTFSVLPSQNGALWFGEPPKLKGNFVEHRLLPTVGDGVQQPPLPINPGAVEDATGDCFDYVETLVTRMQAGTTSHMVITSHVLGDGRVQQAEHQLHERVRSPRILRGR